MKIKHFLASSVSLLMVACSAQTPMLKGSQNPSAKLNAPQTAEELVSNELSGKVTLENSTDQGEYDHLKVQVQLPGANFRTQDALSSKIAFARAEVVGEGLTRSYFNSEGTTINGVSNLVSATGTSITLSVEKLPMGKNRVITLQLYDQDGKELSSLRSMGIFHSLSQQPQAESVFNDSIPSTSALDVNVKRRFVPLALLIKKALTQKNTEFLTKYEKSWDSFVTEFDKILYGNNPVGGNTFDVEPQSIDPDEFYALITAQNPETTGVAGFFTANKAAFVDAFSDVTIHLATPAGFSFNTDLKITIDDPSSTVKLVASNGSASPISTTINNVTRGTRQLIITDSADNILGTTTVTVDPDTGVSFSDNLGSSNTNPLKLLGGSGGLFLGSVAPGNAVLGASITLTGNNFSTTPANNIVKFGSTLATVTAATATQLTVTVPSGLSGAQLVTVEVVGVTTNTQNFAVTPAISSLSASTGTIGSTLTINGTGFDATPGNNTVRFGTTTATVTAVTATQLTVTVPAGISGAQDVSVQVGTQTSANTANDDFALTPTIGSLGASTGSIGSTLTINGTGFDTTPTNNTVRFGTTTATVTAATATQLTVTVPAGISGAQDVSVQVGTQTSANTANDNFAVTPVITSLGASSGTIGSSLTINGTGFDTTPTNNTVRFGTTTATVTAVTPTQLTVTVPAGIVGAQDVSVQVGTQTSTNTANDNFAVTPAITSLGTSSGTIGSSLTINGTGFHTTPTSNTVRFGTTTANVTAATSTQLTVTVPAGVSGTQDVSVQVGTQTSANTANDNFAVRPTISAVSPSSAIISASITISGTGFSPTPASNTVRFGTTTATVTAATATSLTVTVPGGISGTLAVTNQVGTQTSASSNFTVLARIDTVAGTGTSGYTGDGVAATSAGVSDPFGVAVDNSGNIYIAEYSTHRIRKVTPGGIISTVVGNGTPGFSGDGGAATSAQLNNPFDVAVDSSGNLYIADNSNGRIRKVTPGGTISTVATGVSALGVAVDSSGNLYIADTGSHRVRKVTPGGAMSIIAGTGVAGFSGDNGAATSAQLNQPLKITVDSSGNVYFSDQSNHRIRKITPGGTISTVAGIGTGNFGGDGGPATSADFRFPRGIVVDSSGNLYFVEYEGNRVRKVTSGGIISTVSGNGSPSSAGDGGAAVSARVNYPAGLAIDSSGNLYIAEYRGHRIRKITFP